MRLADGGGDRNERHLDSNEKSFRALNFPPKTAKGNKRSSLAAFFQWSGIWGFSLEEEQTPQKTALKNTASVWNPN